MRQTQATIRSQEETGKDRVTLEIEVPAGVVEQELDRVYRQIARDIAIPGFRRGKAPRSVVERRVGKEAFYAEAQKELIHDAFVETLVKTDIKLLSSELIDVAMKEGEPLVFKIEVTKEPVFPIENYKGVKVRVVRPEVTDADVDAALADLRNRYAKLVLVKDRPAERGDVALLEFTGRGEDGQVIEKASDRNFRVELGSGHTVPGFEDGVIGMAVGEERDVPCVFPADYREAALAGRKVTFHMKLKELKRRHVPELTDDFAKEIGEHESLDALRAHLRGELEKAAAERHDDAVKRKVLDALIEANAEIAVPEAMIEHALDTIVKHVDADLRAYRQSLARMLERQGRTLEEFRTESRPRARRMALADIIIAGVAAQEGITATEPDVAAKITEWSENTGQPFAALKEKLEAEGGLRLIREEIVSSKVKDLLARSAVVEYVERDPEEAHEHGPGCGGHDDEPVEATFDGGKA